MNWPVLLSMILIFVIGLTTFKSSGSTNGIIITLVLLMIFYIVYGHYMGSLEGFTDSGMTDKQAIAALVFRLMEKKDGSFVVRILKTLSDSGVTPKSIDDTTPQKLYDAALSEKALFDTIMETSFPPKTKPTFTFDEFFIAMNELMTSDTSSEPIANYKPAFIKWKATKFPKASTSASDSASGSSASAPASGSDSGSASSSASASAGVVAPASGSPDKAAKPITLPDIDKLIQVIKPAPAQTVQPSASASEIGTVIPTSPGLQQGAGYTEVATKRCPPPAPRRCPQPAPQPNCQCQQPIMPDGKPFDPNMYIRKDSIPCWNCQLPI